MLFKPATSTRHLTVRQNWFKPVHNLGEKMDKLAAFFCACTRPRGQDEKNNEHEVYELSELTRFEDYHARIITDDAHDEISSSPSGEIDHVNFLHLSDSEKTLRDEPVSIAVAIHDSFSVIHQYIKSWAIPCVVAYRNTDFDFTRIELLAIGSPATTDWISHIKEDNEVRVNLEQFCEITPCTKHPLCAVLVPRHKLHATKYPVVTRRPRTQLIVPTPITAPPRVRHTFHFAPVGDSDSEYEAS